MRAHPSLLLALALSILGAACTATPPLTPASNSLPECQRVCNEVGLEMTSLVVVGSLVGCVCEVKRAEPRTAGGATGSAAAMIMVQEQQQQQAAAASAKH